jgi:hypothetical protein
MTLLCWDLAAPRGAAPPGRAHALPPVSATLPSERPPSPSAGEGQQSQQHLPVDQGSRRVGGIQLDPLPNLGPQVVGKPPHGLQLLPGQRPAAPDGTPDPPRQPDLLVGVKKAPSGDGHSQASQGRQLSSRVPPGEPLRHMVLHHVMAEVLRPGPTVH